MPKAAAARTADKRSSFQVQVSKPEGSCLPTGDLPKGDQGLKNTPVTAKPACFNRAAATDESTPPDKAT